jgi:hypothetical protein
MRVTGNGEKLVDFAQKDPQMLTSIVAKAKEHGAMSHRFYGSATEILVVDEWPDEKSFHSFFEASPEIRDVLMKAADASGQPEITFWTKLDTGDDL